MGAIAPTWDLPYGAARIPTAGEAASTIGKGLVAVIGSEAATVAGAGVLLSGIAAGGAYVTYQKLYSPMEALDPLQSFSQFSKQREFPVFQNMVTTAQEKYGINLAALTQRRDALNMEGVNSMASWALSGEGGIFIPITQDGRLGGATNPVMTGQLSQFVQDMNSALARLPSDIRRAYLGDAVFNDPKSPFAAGAHAPEPAATAAAATAAPAAEEYNMNAEAMPRTDIPPKPADPHVQTGVAGTAAPTAMSMNNTQASTDPVIDTFFDPATGSYHPVGTAPPSSPDPPQGGNQPPKGDGWFKKLIERSKDVIKAIPNQFRLNKLLKHAFNNFRGLLPLPLTWTGFRSWTGTQYGFWTSVGRLTLGLTAFDGVDRGAQSGLGLIGQSAMDGYNWLNDKAAIPFRAIHNIPVVGDVLAFPYMIASTEESYIMQGLTAAWNSLRPTAAQTTPSKYDFKITPAPTGPAPKPKYNFGIDVPGIGAEAAPISPTIQVASAYNSRRHNRLDFDLQTASVSPPRPADPISYTQVAPGMG